MLKKVLEEELIGVLFIAGPLEKTHREFLK
jgi:hypothetical protein